MRDLCAPNNKVQTYYVGTTPLTLGPPRMLSTKAQTPLRLRACAGHPSGQDKGLASRVDPISQEKSEITVTAISTPRQGPARALPPSRGAESRAQKSESPAWSWTRGCWKCVVFGTPLFDRKRPATLQFIGVSNYRSLEQIEKLSQYRCISVSHSRSLEHSKTVAISESQALWRDCKSHQAPT